MLFQNYLLVIVVVLTYGSVQGQVCSKDSNFYIHSYGNTAYNALTQATLSQEDEPVLLLQHPSQNESFVSKFSSQGDVLWSWNHAPAYVHTNDLQYPWFDNNMAVGISVGLNNTTYLYGHSQERGQTLSGDEYPPKHIVGWFIHIDRYGKMISSNYFDKWGADYTINNVTELNNGNVIVYLTSHFSPFTSKALCIGKQNNILWGFNFQTSPMYHGVEGANPIIKQLTNGNLVVLSTLKRDIDDTLVYPFVPPIILKAPLYFLDFTIIDADKGTLVNQTSYECPSLVNTNVNADFVPAVKGLHELSNGNISVAVDMYWPVDNEIFYRSKVFSRRAVNFIVNKIGFYNQLYLYQPSNRSCSLLSTYDRDDGLQDFLLKDSSDNNLLLVSIGNDGQVQKTKTYLSSLAGNDLNAFAFRKKNGAAIVFQSDNTSNNIYSLITDASGEIACAKMPEREVVTSAGVWAWPVNKVQYWRERYDQDFQYSSLKIVSKNYQFNQTTLCHYEYECCKDVFDSSHNKVSICDNESFQLQDGTLVSEPGVYYAHVKTEAGCDSIKFTDLQVVKSPAKANVTSDTCMENQSEITLKASGGYDYYRWQNTITTDSFYRVTKPGVYVLQVQNSCGSKLDSIHVFSSCNYPTQFPTAFTPNGDFLNDIIRVPPGNKNKLVRLQIYNRFGQLVFVTTDQSKGWNGLVNNQPQPNGTYVYILEMKGLSGKPFIQKGTFVLIR